MAQAVNHRSLTIGVQVQSQANTCGICCGQSGTKTGYSPRTSVFLCQYYSTNALTTSLNTFHCIYLNISLHIFKTSIVYLNIHITCKTSNNTECTQHSSFSKLSAAYSQNATTSRAAIITWILRVALYRSVSQICHDYSKATAQMYLKDVIWNMIHGNFKIL